MYKSLLLLCLVGVVFAQENEDMDYILTKKFINNITSTEDTDNNVIEPVTIVPPVSRPQDSDYQNCTTNDDKEGRCVLYYLCDTNNTVIDDGGGMIDLRVGDLRDKNKPITPRPEIRLCLNLNTKDTDNNVIKPVTIVPPASRPQDSDYQNCTTNDDKEGRCVLYYLCDTNNTVIDDGGGMIDLRVGDLRDKNKPITPRPEIRLCLNLNTKDTDNNVIKPVTIVPPASRPQDSDYQNCTTNDDKEGRCVLYYLCDTNNTVIDDGGGMIDLRVGDLRDKNKPITPRPEIRLCLNLNTKDTDNNVIKPVTIVPPASRPQDSDYQNCTTNDDKEGRCVLYYLCDTNNTVIDDGGGMIDLRIHADNCSSYLEVCCNVGDLRDKDNPITPRPEIRKEGCGWRNPDGIGFKTIGDKDGESKFGEFPWMVAVLKIESVTDANADDQQLNVYVGGGSLIHPAVVLTTAHYVVTAKKLKVRAGEWDTQTTKEIYPYQDRDVDSIIVHKDFNSRNVFYDIALLFLSSPMDTSIPNVGLACLPPPRQRMRGGERCVASGWGKDKFGKEGSYQVILKKVTVPVVERNQCQTKLRQTRLGYFFKLHSSFMCAGGEAGIDTCKGDGGSPLMCPIENEPNRYMQSGMVAWGIGCGDEGVPGVYVDVSNLRDWIDDKIAGYGLDTTVYTI